MRPSYVVIAALLMSAGAPLWGQSVKAGIDAWQKGDYPRAVAIWRPLADKGNADAAFNLGQAYRLGRGTEASLAEAQLWLEVAARKNHVDAESTLGLLLFQNGNQIAGLRWLKAASEQSEPRAMLVYGTALFNGDSTAQDRVQGYCYVSRAAATGLPQAKDAMAQMEQMLPATERTKGVVLATGTAECAPPPRSSSVTANTEPKPTTTPKSLKAAEAPPTATPTWRVQLGAFVRRASAEAMFARLVASGALARRQLFYSPVGAVTRLQAGPFATKAAAEAACAALIAQVCFVVPPGKTN